MFSAVSRCIIKVTLFRLICLAHLLCAMCLSEVLHAMVMYVWPVYVHKQANILNHSWHICNDFIIHLLAYNICSSVL